jgi:4-amino-4-deoxy-L-arabinose transferase-like glycosyltransferase
MEKIFNKKNTLFLVTFVVLFKIFLSATTSLHPDEAYYWLWSQKLAFGYYDHSPMVAWFIRITTLFSNSEFFVRFSSIIVTIILSVLTWKFVKKIFNKTVASASVVVLNTLPLMFIGSVIITPDTPVFLFFAFAVYFLWRLVESNEVKYWYVTGIFFGLALLSKYTAFLFILSLTTYMLLDGKIKWLKNRHFYFMFIVAFIIFLPVIIWNFQNEWISFVFQLKHGLFNNNNKLHINYACEYLGSQCLIAGPFIFISGIIASISYLKSKNALYKHKQLFLFSFSIPIIAIFIFTALKRYPGANWPAFGYFAFSIMTAQYLLSEKSELRKKILLMGVSFNFVVSVLLGLHVKYAIFPIYKFSRDTAIKDPTNWLTGWQELGANILHKNVKYAVTNSHQWGGVIAYYTKGKIGVVLDNDRQNQFAYWNVPSDLATSKIVLVRIDNHLDEDFNILKDAEIVDVKRNGIPIRQYAIIELEGSELKNQKNEMI